MRSQCLYALCFTLGAAVLLTAGCADREAKREKDADSAYFLAHRDLEEDVADLTKAIEGYRKVARDYPGTAGAGKAETRAAQLERAAAMFARVDSVSRDSIAAFYREVCAVAPGYAPAMRKLGTIYYNDTRLGGRSAFQIRSVELADRVLRTWGRQDSLWSTYEFRPTAEDRAWQDNLCRQATDVARMLEGLNRYREALKVTTRGLHYGVSENVRSEAKIFASYYSFRTGAYEEGIALAKEALAYEYLSDNNEGRAYHVIGLCLLQDYDRTKDIADLDAAIDALNSSVTADPAMRQARQLLKTLREARQRLAS